MFYHGASSLVEGDKSLYLPNCQSNLVIALHELTLLFCFFINTTAYLLEDMSLHLPLAAALPGSTKCGTVGKAISSDTGGRQFESFRHWF